MNKLKRPEFLCGYKQVHENNLNRRKATEKQRQEELRQFRFSKRNSS